MNAKRLSVILLGTLWLSLAAFFLLLCAATAHYTFDGMPPCSVPESAACIVGN